MCEGVSIERLDKFGNLNMIYRYDKGFKLESDCDVGWFVGGLHQSSRVLIVKNLKWLMLR